LILFSLLDLKTTIIAHLVESKAFELVTRKIGAFGVLIGFIIDANKVLETSSPDKVKKWASIAVLVYFLRGLFLPLGIAGGTLFSILAYVITMTAITFVLNFIKVLALEAIETAFIFIKDELLV